MFTHCKKVEPNEVHVTLNVLPSSLVKPVEYPQFFFFKISLMKVWYSRFRQPMMYEYLLSISFVELLCNIGK